MDMVSQANKFVVDKGGNPRGKIITEADIKQAILDITEWFKNNAADLYHNKISKIKPGTEAEMNSVRETCKIEIPNELIILLSTYNGGFQLNDTFITLSTNEIILTIQEVAKSPKWTDQLFPIARDMDGQLLAISASPEEGSIVIWDEEIGIIEKQGNSFGEYLEAMRDNLLLKKLEYEEDLGLVSIS